MPPGRNASCPCGSGRKYKHCCLKKGDPRARRRLRLVVFAGVPAVAACAILVGYLTAPRNGGAVAIVGFALIAAYLALRNAPTSRGRTGADRIDFGR